MQARVDFWPRVSSCVAGEGPRVEGFRLRDGHDYIRYRITSVQSQFLINYTAGIENFRTRIETHCGVRVCEYCSSNPQFKPNKCWTPIPPLPPISQKTTTTQTNFRQACLGSQCWQCMFQSQIETIGKPGHHNKFQSKFSLVNPCSVRISHLLSYPQCKRD